MKAEITVEELLPLREYMNEEQIERYGDYFACRKPCKPFTPEEIEKLREKRRESLRKR